MPAGIGKCIADVFRNDIISVPASTYVEKYPLQFNAASAVPEYLYTCLRDIWLTNTNYNPSQWPNMIVDTYGVGNPGTRTIDVTVTRFIEQISGPERRFTSNVPGAEYADVNIYLKLGNTIAPTDIDRITNAELRIRRLIDYNYAQNICGLPEIPVTEFTIDPDSDIRCYWVGASSVLGDSNKSLDILYATYYTRLLLK